MTGRSGKQKKLGGKDEDMKARGIDQASDDDDVLFDYDPEADGEEQQPKGSSGYDYDEYDEGEDEEEAGTAVVTREGHLGPDPPGHIHVAPTHPVVRPQASYPRYLR